MNRSVLTALALGALVALAPAPVGAKPPFLPFCQVDPLVVSDAAGSQAFRVVLRDVNNSPLREYALLDFSRSSVRLYSIQEPGVTFDCASRTLAKITGPDGSATFHPRFGGYANGQDVDVIGDGVVVTSVPARSTDMDGVDGCTGLGDFGMFAQRFLSSSPHPEADFDNSGGPLGLGDFSIFSRDLLSGVKGSYCP